MGGCTASKLDNEDTVRQCKDRCRLMKGAVYARHQLAAAHADYCRSLRVTGSALVSFSKGESFSVSDQTPAVFLRTPPSSVSTKTPPPPPPVRIPSPSPSIRTPHPPPPAQQQRFARSPAPSVARSISSQRHQQLQLPQPRRQKPTMKLPHILSDSSYPTTPTPSNFFAKSYGGGGGGGNSPSQASSVWNWENFEPPPPPPSEYFDQLHHNRDSPDGKSSLKQYDFFDNQSVLNDENASVHSSYSHHSNPGYFRDRDQNLQNNRFHPQNLRKLHDQDPILHEPKHLQHRSESGREVLKYPREDFHNEDEILQSNRFHPQNLRKLHDQYQDPILQKPNHLQHRSESGREEVKYPKRNFHSQDEISQNHRFHPQNLRKLHDQDPILQKPNHLQHRSESGREEVKYPKRDFHSQDEISQNHLQENSGLESDSETEEEEEDLHQDPILQNHRRRHRRGGFHNQDPTLQNHGRRPHPLHQRGDWESETEREELHYSKRDFHNQDPISRHHPGMRNGESEAEREELQCSEYEDHDHYSTSSSGSTDPGEEEEEDGEDLRSETGSAHSKNWPGSASAANARPNSRHHHYQYYSSSVHKQGREEMASDENRMVVRHEDLSEIAEAVKSYFDEAAQSGDRVCDILEAGREQLDRNFKQLKKTVYHSSGIMSSLSSLWSSKPPLAIKYKLEPPLPLSLNHSSSATPKSLCSTLDSLLAWEKKLYREAREGAKIEHERKLATLQSLEYRGGDVGKVDKTKAAINRLQSLIVVTSQAVTATSSSIVGLREADLVPQLVELCHGFKYMWESMNRVHGAQNDVVMQVRGLVDQAARQPTSDPHRQSTRDLESAVSAWHSAFSRVLKFQRDFVRSLHGWFKLSLLPVDGGTPEPPVAAGPTEAFVFCDEWKLALDRVPDTVASEALKSFINVVHSISAKQAEEAKIKKRTDSVAKEMEKKEDNIRNLERKFYSSQSSASAGLDRSDSVGPADGPGLALDARDPLAEKKAELQTWRRRVEDEMVKHVRAIEVTRAMTLNNIQTGLPPVFQAMTSFSALFTEVLEVVCKRSYSINMFD
ncbi:unnamed protein product [Cuscuta campestris]|uniref:DUF632 domain-containing protein n=1 Tax=Cuscuta campestris TaxID=132261 RepID=A0A484L111_9ASTE|nr:unnamed protein product [Cuscuta campestris]